MTEVANRKNEKYYLPHGRIYPSVTTILSVIAKPGLMPWATRITAQVMKANRDMDVEAAAATYKDIGHSAAVRGTEVHRIIQEEAEYIPEKLKGYINAYHKWVEKEGIKVEARELTVFSDENKYAGTLDLTCTDKARKMWIVDIKTGGVYAEHFLQLEAYRAALEEMGTPGLWSTGILKLSADGSYTFITRKEDLSTFLAAKKIWEWKQKAGM